MPGFLLLAGVLAASSPSAELPEDGRDYGAYEDISCRVNAKPRYTRRMERQGMRGTVTYRVSVDASHRFVGAVVHESSGHPEIDAEGMKVLKHWCFRASRIKGERVAGELLVPMKFGR